MLDTTNIITIGRQANRIGMPPTIAQSNILSRIGAVVVSDQRQMGIAQLYIHFALVFIT
nr:hypothetical protein [Granulosicoccus antarcticus]